MIDPRLSTEIIAPNDAGQKDIIYKVLLYDSNERKNVLIKLVNPKKLPQYMLKTWTVYFSEIRQKYPNSFVVSCEKLFYDEGHEYLLKMWYSPKLLNVNPQMCAALIYPGMNVSDVLIVKSDVSFFSFNTIGSSLDAEDTINDLQFYAGGQ